MVDAGEWFEGCEDLAGLAPSPLARGLQGSAILKIAGEVNALKAQGVDVGNFTIGDFQPKYFPVPEGLTRRIKKHLDDGQTNYPPAVGLPELRASIRRFYKRSLGLDYPEGCVQVGSGARPPIFSAFATIIEPGDVVVYAVPSWNVRYYVYINQARGIPLVTQPEDGFMPTAEALLPHLPEARMVVLNSPLNPCGTAIAREMLQEICEAILAENRRRSDAGERPLMLLYDQVYWQLTFGDTEHVTPIELAPEMARYTVMVDAISKAWAATGLRVGWAVVPPWLRSRMKAYVGHMGAWAARAEQLATAEMLDSPDEMAAYLADFKQGIETRLQMLHTGLQAMKAEGLPVDSIAPQGAIYLSAKIDLIGKTLHGEVIDTDEEMRAALLQHAHVAIVPFTAFGYPEKTGWVRFSVGAVSEDDIAGALARLRTLLTEG